MYIIVGVDYLKKEKKYSMVNKSFKQNSLIKYTSILLLSLILVLSMGVTNIFGDLSETEKTTRVNKAVEAAKTERSKQDVSDKEVTDDKLTTEAKNQVDKSDDAQNTQDEVTAAAKKVVSEFKDDKIKTAIQTAQKVILDEKQDPIANLLVVQLGDESVYNAYRDAATQQANHEDEKERTKEKVNEAAKKVAETQLKDAKTARDEKVDTVLTKVKIKSLQDKHELTSEEEADFKAAANKQAENINEAENTEAKVESVVLAKLASILKKKQEEKDDWVNQAVRAAIEKAVESKKKILTQNYRNAAVNASVSKTATRDTVIEAATKVVDDQEKTQEEITTKTTGKQPEHKTGQVQENTPVDVNTVVTGDLGEQAAELTDETAKAAVQKKYSNLQIDQVIVKVDTDNKQVIVSAIDNSQVYTGTATVKYTVKAATSDKSWYKSVVLWVSVGIAFAVAAVGIVYYLNKNKKFKK